MNYYSSKWFFMLCVVICNYSSVYAFKPTSWWNNPEQLEWSEITSMPVSVSGAGAAFLNGNYYSLGGYDSSGTPYYQVQKYNGSTWSVNTTYAPGGTHIFNCCSWNNKIVTTPGRLHEHTTIYNPADDTWVDSTSCPNHFHCFCAIVSISNTCYMFGGIDQDVYSSAEAYKWIPGDSMMTAIASLPTAQSGLAIAAYNNKIYLFGGGYSSAFDTLIWEYDPNTNSYTEKAAHLTQRREYSSAATIGDKIYIFSGQTTGFNPVLQVDCYYPDADTIAPSTDMMTGFNSQSGAGGVLSSTTGALYVSGGSIYPSGPVNNAFKGSITGIVKVEATSLGRIKTLYR